MNAFEMELKKILSQSKEAAHTTYVGRAAYIQVAPELRAKLEFVSLNIANQYNALKLTVLNRIDGAVDINISVLVICWERKWSATLTFRMG